MSQIRQFVIVTEARVTVLLEAVWGFAIKCQAATFKLWAADAEMAPILARQAGVEIRKLFTFDIVPMFLACNRNVAPDLINRLAAALKNAYEDGTVDRISARYRCIPAIRMLIGMTAYGHTLPFSAAPKVYRN